MTQETKPVKRISDLGTLKPETVDLVFEYDDHDEVMPMKTLSYGEWQRIGWSVPTPAPPISGVDGNKRPIVNYDDPQFRIQSQQAELERAYRRVLASMVLPVPGETEAEQVDFIKNMDADRLRIMISFVNDQAVRGRSRVGVKAQFPDDGGTGVGAGVSTHRKNAG